LHEIDEREAQAAKGGKKIDEYVLREALGRQKRLCVGFNKEKGEKLYRPAVKLSK
jgi:hypothetical protein